MLEDLGPFVVLECSDATDPPSILIGTYGGAQYWFPRPIYDRIWQAVGLPEPICPGKEI